jgi:hypothetical protein
LLPLHLCAGARRGADGPAGKSGKWPAKFPQNSRLLNAIEEICRAAAIFLTAATGQFTIL